MDTIISFLENWYIIQQNWALCWRNWRASLF